ncbi:hypothetical protein [Candidatus Vondammii sp. HM_W22]|uniref:hypothetical protein n=1 Tax=Candidatus Vondammii sp. HM_W22 TaxID=2687299 RepID=UPI001F12A2EB|nr:hypothetical protein [Candidatus Vondammii sp. HM_W22]
MGYRTLIKSFDHHVDAWLDEFFGGQDSIVINTTELEADEFLDDEIIDIFNSLEDRGGITFLYHENGPDFIDIRRGLVPTDEGSLS